MMAKTTNLMYRLNVQVTAYGRQTVLDRGVVRSCDPLQNFRGSNHITGTAEPKVVKFCTWVVISILATRWHITNKRALLWWRDGFKILPFVVIQRVARVCQRQLSYLFLFLSAFFINYGIVNCCEFCILWSLRLTATITYSYLILSYLSLFKRLHSFPNCTFANFV